MDLGDSAECFSFAGYKCSVGGSLAYANSSWEPRWPNWQAFKTSLLMLRSSGAPRPGEAARTHGRSWKDWQG